jgi:hypothetical protein
VDALEQLRGLWNILGTKPSVYGAIFSNFQAERQSNHCDFWSGRWESNPRPKAGKLRPEQVKISAVREKAEKRVGKQLAVDEAEFRKKVNRSDSN